MDAVPFSVVFVLVTAVVTALVRWGVARPQPVLRWMSTNVHNLAHRPLTSLVVSALYVDSGPWLTWVWIVGLAAVLAYVELRYGTARAAIAFASGQVIATLLTESAVAVGIAIRVLPHADARWPDVGVSYGFAATLAVAITVPHRRRGARRASSRRPDMGSSSPRRRSQLRPTLALAAAVSCLLVALLVADPSMTPAGHLIAFAVGLLYGVTLRIAHPAGSGRPRGIAPKPGRTQRDRIPRGSGNMSRVDAVMMLDSREGCAGHGGPPADPEPRSGACNTYQDL